MNEAVQCSRCETGGRCERFENRAAVDENFLRAVVDTDPERQAREQRELTKCSIAIGIGLVINLIATFIVRFAMGDSGENIEEVIVFGGAMLWLGYILKSIFGTPYIPGAPPPTSLPDERHLQLEEEERARECPFRFKRYLHEKAARIHRAKIGRRVVAALFAGYLCYVIAFITRA